ncbi:MAG: 2Fe-2S iron-sulfur cluster-binding protein [Cytophagaceae bacterium]
MTQYYQLKVKEIIQETPDAVSLVFQKPEKGFEYKAGQFLTLIFTISGEKHRRSYSLCSSSGIDNDLVVTVKRVINGKISNYIADNIRIGDTIDVMSPSGNFIFTPDKTQKRNIVLIGAGSGITPLMSILKTILYDEPQSTVSLLYGNRNEQSIIYFRVLNELKMKFTDRFNLIYFLSQPEGEGEFVVGRLNQSEIIKQLERTGADLRKSEYFICGPEGMMHEVKKSLDIIKLEKERIHQESFVNTISSESTGKIVDDGQNKEQEVVIIYQGSEYKVKVKPEQTILAAALDADIDLPYSCQSGLCTACMGKCVSGKVHLDEKDALSDKELQQGYVLTCVGHPVTSDVVIEID